DFRGLVYWMQNVAPPEFLASLYLNCGRFERGGWKYNYHPKVAEAMVKNTWFKGSDGSLYTSYVILVTLQMVIHCATAIMHALQRLYQSRIEKFGNHLLSLNNSRRDLTASIVGERPESIKQFAGDSTEDSTLKRERLDQLNESMKALRETV